MKRRSGSRIVDNAVGSGKTSLDIGGASIDNMVLRLITPRSLSSQSSQSFMADDSFDVSSLATYLHMMPAQISRLAERGKLPGRRIGGQWRFSRPEIGQWLEQRIGISGDDELAAMESNLRRDDSHGASVIDLAELLPLEAIAVPLEARTRSSVVRAMCELGANTGRLWDVDRMVDAVSERESMAPTALEHGVALLHPRRPQASILGEAVLAMGISTHGVPFGGSAMTDTFILIAATGDREYLRILARVSRIVNDREWVAALRTASNAAAARRLVLDRDASLNG